MPLPLDQKYHQVLHLNMSFLMSCRDDRLAWMTALTRARIPSAGFGRAATECLPFSNGGVTQVLPTNGTTSEPAVAALAQTAADLQARFDATSDSPSMRLVTALQKQVRHVAAVVEERDSQIRQLMDERRQLQTELVAESQRLDGLEVRSASPCLCWMCIFPWMLERVLSVFHGVA